MDRLSELQVLAAEYEKKDSSDHHEDVREEGGEEVGDSVKNQISIQRQQKKKQNKKNRQTSSFNNNQKSKTFGVSSSTNSDEEEEQQQQQQRNSLHIKAFLSEASRIRDRLEDAAALLGSYEQQADERRLAISSQDQTRIQEAMRDTETRFTRSIQQAFGSIKGLQKRNTEISLALEADAARSKKTGFTEEGEEGAEDSYDLYIREVQTSSLFRKTQSLMRKWNELQDGLTKGYKNALKRQILILNPDLPEEQVAALIEETHDGNSEPLLSSTIQNDWLRVTGGRTIEDFQLVLTDIQTRRTEIMKLEASLIELNQMFADVSVLLENQSEALDNIETLIESAEVLAEGTVVNLKAARKYQKKAKSKKRFLWVVVVGAIAAAVMVPLSAVARVFG